MQLGFVSAILPDLSLDEVLSFAAQTGYECVEVMCWPPGKAERRYAGVTHIDVTTVTKDTAPRIHELTAKHNVAISGLGYYPNVLSPNKDEAEVAEKHIREVIRAAAVLGLGVVNTFVGRDYTLSLDDNWPRFKQTWAGLIRHAEEHNVKIGIENCPMLFTKDEWPGGKNLATTPAIWRRMWEDIPSPNFGLNFDPSHFIWQQMDYLKPLREFASRLHHMHAKDARVDRHKLDDVGILAYPNLYHTPKLPGMGDVNWGAFFSALTDSGYRGPVCVEVEDRAFEGSLEDRKASLRQAYNYLKQFFPGR
ncbi:MAG: sugar phosphate isomerase/epimerase family protein [Bryobacteraceae bacterium]|nr:sugar phosphate isomerase/epimerase family protein [Bryobacteraceae bacterium]